MYLRKNIYERSLRYICCSQQDAYGVAVLNGQDCCVGFYLWISREIENGHMC